MGGERGEMNEPDYEACSGCGVPVQQCGYAKQTLCSGCSDRKTIYTLCVAKDKLQEELSNAEHTIACLLEGRECKSC